MSYGFTKSFAASLFCKFQPAFNTSPTVAALFLFTWSVPVPNVGAVALVVGAFVPALAPSKLPPTLVIELPPLFKPSFVKDTGCLPLVTGVIVTPSPLIAVVSPAAFLNPALVKSVKSFCKE